MKFSEIIGQDRVKKHLIRTVKGSRVSHAQLFLGPEGVGSLALAIAYAQYINCRNRTEADSCGICPSCIKYNKLIHPDLHFIYPTASKDNISKPGSKDFIESWRALVLEHRGYFRFPDWTEKIGIERKQAIINVNDCNDLLQQLSYKSYEAEYKVMIIWMVEKIFHAAAPRILKILEEPPDKTLFLLVSQSHEKIISTILSRTQLVKIPPVDENDLIDALDKEGIDIKTVRDAVRVASGNYIEAKRLATQTETDEDHLNRFIQWMRLCYRIPFKEINAFASEMAKLNRDAQKNFLLYSLRIIREAFLMGLPLHQLLRIKKSEEDFLMKFHPFVHQNNIDLLTDELNKSVAHIERNVNSNILFFDATVRLSQLLKMR
ncbi:MAG: ATP-binding protein [Bacteroidales bacterium]